MVYSGFGLDRFHCIYIVELHEIHFGFHYRVTVDHDTCNVWVQTDIMCRVHLKGRGWCGVC
jgi:hypothetical protein